MIPFYERVRNIGLTGGCLWLLAAGMGFSSWTLLAARSAAGAWLLAVMSLLAVASIVFGIAMIRGVVRLPSVRTGDPTAGKRAGKRLRRGLGLAVGAEVAGIAVVNVASAATHHGIFMVPLDLVVVGLHFLPLARLFKVPRYYITGILFCAIPIVTMLTIDSRAHVGQVRSWMLIPSVGCALVAFATAWAGLNEVRRFVRASQALTSFAQ